MGAGKEADRRKSEGRRKEARARGKEGSAGWYITENTTLHPVPFLMTLYHSNFFDGLIPGHKENFVDVLVNSPGRATCHGAPTFSDPSPRHLYRSSGFSMRTGIGALAAIRDPSQTINP